MAVIVAISPVNAIAGRLGLSRSNRLLIRLKNEAHHAEPPFPRQNFMTVEQTICHFLCNL